MEGLNLNGQWPTPGRLVSCFNKAAQLCMSRSLSSHQLVLISLSQLAFSAQLYKLSTLFDRFLAVILALVPPLVRQKQKNRPLSSREP